MTTVERSISEPARQGLSWGERWQGPDEGLISAWERGIEKARESPALAASAARGELPALPWKGGSSRKTKLGFRYGSLYYLAMWQGLRGENLNVSLEAEIELLCSLIGMRVVFTHDENKLIDEGDVT